MSAYDEAAEKAVKQVITNYFESHPVLSDISVAEKLAGLLNSDNERIVLGAIKMWSVLRQMKPQDEEDTPSTMEEVLRTEMQTQARTKESEEVMYIEDRPSPHGQPWEHIGALGVPAHGGHRGSH